MNTKQFVLSMARGARGKEAAKALILPQIFGGLGKVNAGKEYEISGTPPLSLPNSLGKPLKAWAVEVSPYQEGSGDPSPDNVRPIHGTDKVTVWTAGKNLLSYPYYFTTQTSNGCTATVADDGTVTFSGAPSNHATFNIKRRTDTAGNGSLFLQAGTYILNGCPAGGSSTTYQISVIAQDGSTLAVDRGSGLSITIPSGGMYIGVQLFVNAGYDPSALKMSPMIRLASIVDDTYTPYLAPSQTVLTLPQTVYTGTIGSEGGESRSAKLVLTGTENFVRFETVTGHWRFGLSVANSERSTSPNAISNMYKACTPSETYLGVTGVSHNTMSSTLFICDEQFTTVEELKTFLAAQYAANTPVYIVYPLETPTTIPLTSPTIPTPTGTATTWATAEDGTVESMEVTYVGKA